MTTMNGLATSCMLCEVEVADAYFSRVRLWEDRLWRLSAVPQGPIPVFGHLEPCRHIPFITDLDGAEAANLGAVLTGATSILRDAAGADKTYVYIFGDHTPHLHLNLAPHHEGDALVGGPGLLRPDAPEAGVAAHEAVVAAARRGFEGFRLP